MIIGKDKHLLSVYTKQIPDRKADYDAILVS